MKTYPAPWCTSLKLTSWFTTVMCVTIAMVMLARGSEMLLRVALLPLALVGVAALFTIRGYSLTPDSILVRRLCWTTRLPLAGLRSAEFKPEVMRRSLRLFGNGGLFAFSGWFRNRELGTYRAWVTDPQRTVVLIFPARTWVISPSAPAEFVRDLGAPA